MLYPKESTPEKKFSSQNPSGPSEINLQLSKAIEAGDLDKIDQLISAAGWIDSSAAMPLSKRHEFRKILEKALEVKRAGIFYHLILRNYCSYHELAAVVKDINSQPGALYPKFSLAEYVYQILKARNLLEFLLACEDVGPIVGQCNNHDSMLLVNAALADDAKTVALLLEKGTTVEELLRTAEEAGNQELMGKILGVVKAATTKKNIIAETFNPEVLIKIALKNNFHIFSIAMLASRVISQGELSHYIRDPRVMGESARDTLFCYASSTGPNYPYLLGYLLKDKDGMDVQKEINQTDSMYGTALMAAVIKNKPKHIRALCDSGADLFITDRSGLSVFKHAADDAMLSYLIEKSLSVKSSKPKSERLHTLIRILVTDRVSEGLIYLLEQNLCDLNYLEKTVTSGQIMGDRKEISLVCLAASLEPDFLKLVLGRIKESGKEPQEEINELGQGLALFCCIINPHISSASRVENIKILAEYKADIFTKLMNSNSVFYLSARLGHMPELDTLYSLAIKRLGAKQLKKEGFLLKKSWFKDIIIGAFQGNQARPILYLLENKICILEDISKAFIDLQKMEGKEKNIKQISLSEYAKTLPDRCLLEYLDRIQPQKHEVQVAQKPVMAVLKPKKPKKIKSPPGLVKEKKSSHSSDKKNIAKFPPPKIDHAQLITSQWSEYSYNFIDVHEERIKDINKNLQRHVAQIREKKELATSEEMNEHQMKLDKILRILIDFHYHLQEQKHIITKFAELLGQNEENLAENEVLMWNKKLMELNALYEANSDRLKILEEEVSSSQKQILAAREKLKKQKKREKTDEIALARSEEGDSIPARMRPDRLPRKPFSTPRAQGRSTELKKGRADNKQPPKSVGRKSDSTTMHLRRSGMFSIFQPPIATLAEIKKLTTRINDCLPELEKAQKDSKSSETGSNRLLLEQMLLAAMFFSSELLLKKLPENSPPRIYFNHLRNRIVHEQWKVQRHWLANNGITQAWREFVDKLALLYDSNNSEMFTLSFFQNESLLDLLVDDRNDRVLRQEDSKSVEDEQIQLALARSKLQQNLQKSTPHADYFSKLLIAFNAATFEECLSRLPALTCQKILKDERFAKIMHKGRALRHDQGQQLSLVRGEQVSFLDPVGENPVKEEDATVEFSTKP